MTSSKTSSSVSVSADFDLRELEDRWPNTGVLANEGAGTDLPGPRIEGRNWVP